MVAASSGKESSPPSGPLANRVSPHGRELQPGFLRSSPSRSQLHLVPRRRILRPPPLQTAFRVPAGRFAVDSRRRHRSSALNHIPPLTIPHGLEYPLASRMHLVFVNRRLEAREQPFPRSHEFRSRLNLSVLRPLTRGPQGQFSTLRTPRPRVGVQGIFPTSRGQAPHGWRMVHHSMATGFPIPRGCCFALSFASFSLLCLVRNPMIFHSPLPHPVTGPAPASDPSSRVYTPPVRQ